MNVKADFDLSVAIPTLDDLNLLGAFLGNQHYGDFEVAAPESFANYVPIFAYIAQPEEEAAGSLRYTAVLGL